MKVWPRHVRSRLTLWYVLGLASLLALYAGGAAFFLFLSLREGLDRDLVKDLEAVEGMLANEPDGLVSLHSKHRAGDEPRVGHFIEVWSPAGPLLYRSQALQDQTLGGPPNPGEGSDDPVPSTVRLANGIDARVVSAVYHIEDHRVVIRVAYSEEPLWRELREFGAVLLLAFPIVVFLAGVGGYALARKALAPIHAMTNQAEKISAERLSDRLSVENPEDELGKLASVINAMLGRLHSAFDQLRRFTSDASHELRTPLTAIRSVGEVALQDQAIPPEYRDVMGSMLEEVDQLTRLSESLLELSRADAGHVHLQRADIALLTVAHEANSMVEVLAEEKGQRIDIEGDAYLIVSVDRLLLRQAIANLLDNAIKYSPANSRISVQVHQGAEQRAWLDITDQGPGIPTEHQSYVFDRFYRVDPARSRELGGVGLGLSITRWVVEAHGGQISLRSKEWEGATFRVSLPLANVAAPSRRQEA
jgi:heavy metal sensor kinase